MNRAKLFWYICNINNANNIQSPKIIRVFSSFFSCAKFGVLPIKVLDYTQYYLNLAEANSAGEALWQPEYNLTTHYFGSGEVTAVALHNLADRFSNTDNPFFTK